MQVEGFGTLVQGTTSPPHVHLGPADCGMTSGVMEHRGGVSRAGRG